MTVHTYRILATNACFIPASEGNYMPQDMMRYATLYDLLPANHAATLEYDPSILKGTIAINTDERNNITDIKFLTNDSFEHLSPENKAEAIRIDDVFIRSKDQHPAWLQITTRYANQC